MLIIAQVLEDGDLKFNIMLSLFLVLVFRDTDGLLVGSLSFWYWWGTEGRGMKWGRGHLYTLNIFLVFFFLFLHILWVSSTLSSVWSRQDNNLSEQEIILCEQYIKLSRLDNKLSDNILSFANKI